MFLPVFEVLFAGVDADRLESRVGEADVVLAVLKGNVEVWEFCAARGVGEEGFSSFVDVLKVWTDRFGPSLAACVSCWAGEGLCVNALCESEL